MVSYAELMGTNVENHIEVELEEQPPTIINKEALTRDEKRKELERFYNNKDWEALVRFYLVDIEGEKLKDDFEYMIVKKKTDATIINIHYLYFQRRMTFVEFIHIKEVNKKGRSSMYDMHKKKIHDHLFIQAVKHLSKCI